MSGAHESIHTYDKVIIGSQLYSCLAKTELCPITTALFIVLCPGASVNAYLCQQGTCKLWGKYFQYRQ